MSSDLTRLNKAEGPQGPDDPDYSPEYQDAYQRLWWEASAVRDRYKAALREIAEADAKTPVMTLNHIAERALSGL